jgi:hypothetical protein
VPDFGTYNSDHHQKKALASLRDTLTEVKDKRWADQVQIQRKSAEAWTNRYEHCRGSGSQQVDLQFLIPMLARPQV